MSRRLKADELRATCDPATLPFRSTAELEPLHGSIGQQRALDATTFGIEMKPGGYLPQRLARPESLTRAIRDAAPSSPHMVVLRMTADTVHSLSSCREAPATSLPRRRPL